MSPLAQASFFKYKPLRELNYLQDLILRHQLFIPRAKQLNDPREAKPTLAALDAAKIARVLKRNFFKDKPGLSLDERVYHANVIDRLAYADPEKRNREIKEILYARFDEYRIFSMSKRWNNLAMWAWYAENHRGYCLEFANKGLFEVAEAVVYDDTGEVDVSDEAQLTFNWFSRKATDWQSEEEVRVVLPHAIGGGQLITIQPDWLVRIILGKDTPKAESDQIREWAAQREPALEVVQARFDAHSQRLVLDRHPASSDESRTG